MRNVEPILRNSAWADAIPSALAKGRGSDVARRLAQARWLLRRKRDGRYLATADHAGTIHSLLPLTTSQSQVLRQLLTIDVRIVRPLPLSDLWRPLLALGIEADYGERYGLPPVAEPTWLALAGHDRYRRPLWLRPDTARAWKALRATALAQGIPLEAISGFRSHAYQLTIFRRKQARGLSLEQILAVNAAPGFSEHHGGFAIDIGAPGEPPAEVSFERTRAFAWLCGNAAHFGFAMSYPRDNPHGIAYEPWHWAHRSR